MATKNDVSPASSSPCMSWQSLDEFEQLTVVCDLFFQRLKMTEILTEIKAAYTNVNLTRESILPLVYKAMKYKLIQYTPTTDAHLSMQFKSRYSWLTRSEVVHTSTFSDVAFHGANMLLDLIKEYRHSEKSEIHVGFAGGHAMRILAYQFSKLLENLREPIPQKIFFHALVAGFNVHEPKTDPNTFFTFFLSENETNNLYDFVGLYALPLIKSKDYVEITKRAGVKEAFQEKEKIDIFVTSATSWDDEHSLFKQYMNNSKGCLKKLENANCIGDLLWLPIGEKEAIDPNVTVIRSMTLLKNLQELNYFINKDKKVLLILGPCAKCSKTKSSILNAVLNQETHIITHLVADSRSIKEVLKINNTNKNNF